MKEILEFEEYKELGKLIKEFQKQYIIIHDLARKRMPKTLGRKHLYKIYDQIIQLKGDLENLMAKDYPDKWSTDIFYGELAPE